jgi:cation transport regulator ChaC
MSATQIRFGYGSNMSVDNLRKKKNLDVGFSAPGIAHGWELGFFSAIAHVEPAFAMAQEAPNGQLHGLVFEIPSAQAEALDKQEKGYDVVVVPVHLYDGRVINAGLYSRQNGSDPEALPSLRYARLLAKGAREAGLAEDYATQLEQRFYVTPPQVRAITLAAIEAAAESPLLSMDEVAGSIPPRTSLMGMVVEVEPPFASWKNHDITRRNLIHFRGLSVDTMDVRYGQPDFFPLPRPQTNEETEYLWQNLDCLIHRGGKIVGRLREWNTNTL